MIFHRFRKPNFLRSEFARRILGQPSQSTTRCIRRRGEHMAVVINGRGNIDPHSVGGFVISPEQLAVSSGNSSDGHREKLDVLALTPKVDRDGRRVRGAGVLRAHVFHAHFVFRQFAVVIDIQFLERPHGVLDFRLINDTVFIGVERGESLHHTHDARSPSRTRAVSLAVSPLGTHLIFGKLSVLVFVQFEKNSRGSREFFG